MYREELANRKMNLEYVRLAWHHYLGGSIYFNPISALEEQDELNMLPSLIARAEMDSVVVPATYFSLSSAIRRDERDCTMGGVV